MKIDVPAIVARYTPTGWAVRIGLGVLAAVLLFFAVMRLPAIIKAAIFGDPAVKQEHANTVVAQEQTKAEANIAAKAIEKVHEQDIYREHITNVVHETQEKINEVDTGQQMDPAIDAATADGLCRVHNSLCRPAAPADVQPVRQPIS